VPALCSVQVFSVVGNEEDSDVIENLSLVSGLLAYFDPGSGSLVLQAIVGGTAGLFVFAKYMWDIMPSFLRRRSAANDRESP
jgi:hypothetical protein